MGRLLGLLPGRHRRQPPLGRDLEEQLRTAVRRAAGHYGAGRYGRGEYELVRLGLSVARRYGDTVSAGVLADLRFVQEPPRNTPPAPPPPPAGINPTVRRTV